MKKSFVKLYFINVLNLLIICFIIEIMVTLFMAPTDNDDFNGINIWVIFVFYLIYKLGKLIKNNAGRFLVSLFICFIPVFIVHRYFIIFDFVEPNFYGFKNVLLDFLPTNLDADLFKFRFWQTGVASGFIYTQHTSNYIITFFTVPPIALFECFLKAIFPNLYIILLIQLPFIMLKCKLLDWTAPC